MVSARPHIKPQPPLPATQRSAKSLVRLGFQREGHLRERWMVAGEVSDSALYGLLAREWQQGAVRGGET